MNSVNKITSELYRCNIILIVRLSGQKYHYYSYLLVLIPILRINREKRVAHYFVCGICGTHGGYETAEVRDVGRNGGGRARVVWGARKKSVWGVSWTSSKLSASTPTSGRPTSGRLQPRTRGNGAEQQNKGGNISWRNGSLQRKPRLDYGMQWYART